MNLFASRKKKLASQRRGRFLRMGEQLEPRAMCAANVLAEVKGETLVVVGDSQANFVNITRVGAGKFAVDVDGADGTLNSGIKTLQFEQVRRIDVRLGSGSDRLLISGGRFGNDGIPDLKSISVDAGLGDEHVLRILGQELSENLTVSSPAKAKTDLRVQETTAQEISLVTGSGHDKIEIKDVRAQTLTARSGAGNDTLLVDGSVAVDNRDRKWIGKLAVDTSSGDDRLTIQDARIDSVMASLGSGHDILRLGSVDFLNGYLDGGAGSDAWWQVGIVRRRPNLLRFELIEQK